MEEPDSYRCTLIWLNPKHHRPRMDAEYLLLAHGEKGRTYGVMAVWNGLLFQDDMGIEYYLKNIIAFADLNLVNRPPFTSNNPTLRARPVNKRRYKGL